MTVYVKLLAGLLLVGTVLVFAGQNSEVVTVKLLTWRAQMSQSVLIFAAFTVGVLTGSLMIGWVYWGRWRSRKKSGVFRGSGSRKGIEDEHI